jgi:transposase
MSGVASETLSERVEALEASLAALAAQNATLAADNAKLAHERERYHALYLQLLEINKKLERGLLGQKAERLPADEAQLTLQLLATLLGDHAPQAPERENRQAVAPHTRRKPTGRKPLPEHLPRVEIELVPDEVTRLGLDAFVRIGEEVSEVVERRPASLVAVCITRPKFVRRERAASPSAQVTTAEPLELPIPRGLAGPGLLADTVVRRWQDHLPLHRLESIYAREGLELARSTLCGWHEELASLARPLVDAMWEDAFESPYLCTDATGVLVQARERCRRSHFWVVVAPARHVADRRFKSGFSTPDNARTVKFPRGPPVAHRFLQRNGFRLPAVDVRRISETPVGARDAHLLRPLMNDGHWIIRAVAHLHSGRIDHVDCPESR